MRTLVLNAILLGLLFTGGCGSDSGTPDSGADGSADGVADGSTDGTDGGDLDEPDGGDLDEPDGGDLDEPDGGDGSGDEDYQVNYSTIHLSGDFNEWAAADSSLEFQPAADHLWRLEADFSEGRHLIKLTTDSSWTVNFGALAVAHDDSLISLEQGGPNVDLVCLFSGTYVFEFDDLSSQLTVSLAVYPVASPALFDAEPRSVDNRHLGALLIDGLLTDGPTLPDTMDSLLATGGTPLRGGQKLHFLAMAPSGSSDPVYLVGSFNGWDPANLALQPLAGTRLHYGNIPVPQGHLAYKFVHQGQWLGDPLNPNVEWDGIPVAGLGEFNSIVPASVGDRSSGRLLRLAEHASLIMGDSRDVFIYLPLDYDLSPDNYYPLMLVHDGNESIARSQFDLVADEEISAGRVRPLVMVFVALPNQNQRMDDYTFNTDTSRGHLYRQYVADELVPEISGLVRLSDDLELRAVFGASLGGLISYYIGWERPDAFGLVAGMSSTFFWDDNWMLVQVQNDSGPLKPLRFYLDSADVNDNHDVTVLMQEALQARSYPHRHVVQVGASHDWYFWKERFPGMLQYLFPPVR